MPKQEVKRRGRPKKVVIELNNAPIDHISLANADALCKIIKQCAQSNVREFKIGALSLEFGPRDPSPTIPSFAETRPNEQVSQQIISKEAFAKEQADRAEHELENLRLLDPLAYERLVEGEINVGDSS